MKMFLLVDKSDESFTDLIIFDEEQNKSELKRAIEQVRERESWEFEDLLESLNKFGKYNITSLSSIEMLEY